MIMNNIVGSPQYNFHKTPMSDHRILQVFSGYHAFKASNFTQQLSCLIVEGISAGHGTGP